MTDKPDILLRLRSVEDAVPEAIRLRRLLKALLRAYGFKCLSVEGGEVRLYDRP